MLIGFILIVIGILWLFKNYSYELAYQESLKYENIVRIAYLTFHPKWDYIHGMWLMPLGLGIVLFLDSLNMIPNITIKKVKKFIKKD